MSPEFSRRLMVRLAKASPEERKRIIAGITPHDLLMLDADFESWAQEGQLPPLGEGWRVWLMLAGRGFGKTRAGAEWIHKLACGRKRLRIALVASSIAEARSIMVEGVSGIMSVAGRNQRRVTWEPSLNRLRWRGGSEAQLFSGDSPDGLRGPEHDFAWCAAGARRGGFGCGRRLPLATPPASPPIGSCYIVGGSPSGVWSGHAHKLAAYTSGGWRFVAPFDGLSAIVRSSGSIAVYRNGAWEIGQLRGSEVTVDGVKVVGARKAAIAAPAGGSTADLESRAAISAILAAMRDHGLIES